MRGGEDIQCAGGGIYRKKTAVAVKPDSRSALHFYELASRLGTGEPSERIAEMFEHVEVSSSSGQTAASWRALAVKQGWAQQELVVFCTEWIHGPEPLHCDVPSFLLKTDPLVANGCPSAADMTRLRNQGLRGTIRQDGGNAQVGDGPAAKAILIMDRPVVSVLDLQQPYAASVVYLQKADGPWQMLPLNAPLLDRYIVITAAAGGPGIASMIAQNPDGSGGAGPVVHQPELCAEVAVRTSSRHLARLE